MSTNRFPKLRREPEKDLVECEKFLNRVLKRKIDKPRNSARNKSKQNDNQNRTVKPFLTGPSSRPQSSSPGVRECCNTNKPSRDKIIHKEVIGSNKATVEVTLKAKQTEKSRKRSISTSCAVPHEKNNDVSKQASSIDPLTSNKLSNQLFNRKQSRSRSPARKNLPWSQVLKENSKVPEAPGKGMCHNSHDKILHVKGHLNFKDPIESKPVIKSRTSRRDGHLKKENYFNCLESMHVNSIESRNSAESSGISSSIDEVACVNKSVQCWLPPASALHGDSTTTVSSAKIPEEVNVKRADSSRGAASNPFDTYSVFNPLRTLNFLIKELHGFVRKTEDKHLRRIITDMERALFRIPLELHGGDVPQSLGSYHNSDMDTLRQFEPGVQLLKQNISNTAEAMARTLASVPTLALRVDSSLPSNLDINSGKTSATLGGATAQSDNSAVMFQKQLEESCIKLETMCQEMEATNAGLLLQKEKVMEELKAKNQEIEMWVTKERDYLQTITTLRSNLESSGRMMTELTNLTAQLREENKTLSGTREAQFKLNQQIQELQRANEQLQKELKLQQLEKEKLTIISQGKDNELERFKNEVLNIKTYVLDGLNSMKQNFRGNRMADLSSSSGLMCTSDLESLTSDIGAYLPASQQTLCSSNSSISSNTLMDIPWQVMGSFQPVNSMQSIPDLVIITPVSIDSSYHVEKVTELPEVEESACTVSVVQNQELREGLEMLFDVMRNQTKCTSTTPSMPGLKESQATSVMIPTALIWPVKRDATSLKNPSALNMPLEPKAASPNTPSDLNSLVIPQETSGTSTSAVLFPHKENETEAAS